MAAAPNNLARIIALCAGCGAASIFSLAAWAGPTREPAARPIDVITTATPAPVPTSVVKPNALRASSELLFVFRAGGATYVRLADLPTNQPPKHGQLRFVDDGHGAAAIGVVKDADAPARYRGLRGKRLRVDGICSANVVGLAVVARLAGDTAHAAVDDETWTAGTVLQHGALVLAARIDGCESGTYARAAALSEVVRPTKLADEDLANAARSALLASKPALETQRAWKAAALQGHWYDHVDLAITVMRHPSTEVTWVAVHGIYSEIDCGGPDVNVWGLFRVGRDRKLETVDVRKLDTLSSIDHIIDLDGDGDLELIGKPWLGLETVLVEAAGERELDRLPMPFFGCAC